MKNRKRRSHSKSKERKESEYLQHFRQRLYSKNRNYQRLFAELKLHTNRNEIASVAELFHNSNNPFHRIMYGLTFAKTYAEPYETPFFAFTDNLEKELTWLSISVLRYATELSQFVSDSMTFQQSFLLGNFQKSHEIIRSIVASCGLSLWTMEKTFLLKDMTEGLEANKTFLTELVADTNNDVLLKFIASYISMRAETKVSPENYRLKLHRALDSGTSRTALHDYLLYHLDYFDSDMSKVGARVAFCESSSTIIDRYLTFTALCQACVSAGSTFRNIVCQAVEPLHDRIKDHRLDLLFHFCQPNTAPHWNTTSARILKSLDLYTTGDYQASLTASAELLAENPSIYELYYIYLHSQGYLNKPFEQLFLPEAPAAGLLSRLNSVIRRDGNWRSSIDALLKMAMYLGRDPMSYGLYHLYVDETQPSPEQRMLKLALLNATHINPRFAYVFDDHQSAASFLNQLNLLNPGSSTVALLKRLTPSRGLESDELPDSIPLTRRMIYQATIHEAAERPHLAVAELKPLLNRIEKGEIAGAYLLADRVAGALFRSFLDTEAFAECTDMVVHLFLNNPAWIRKIPHGDLVKRIDEIRPPDVMRKITYPILYSLLHTKARSVYIAYDNFLAGLGVSRPTQLIEKPDAFYLQELNYFLAKVCTIDVLACSYRFSGTSDMEEERIRIC